MGLGKKIRLARLFSNPSGRLCSVAVDHFIGYQKGLPEGLTHLPEITAKLVACKPDAITMHKGLALQLWEQYAGQIPLLISAVMFTAGDEVIEQTCRPAEAAAMGADGIAVAIGVRGKKEGTMLNILSRAVEEARVADIPVVAHVYPRDYTGEPKIVHDPENIMWAVRCGIECGADVIKTPYTGDIASFRDIVRSSPVPVVAAGGPKAANLDDAVQLMADAVAAGAAGATIGRNIWGSADPAAAFEKFKKAVHGK
jgi:class I fructose-bisphosphate aldolase